MPKAIWNDVLLAETDTYEVVEGNVYFPLDTINKPYFRANQTTSYCPWKGTASYYDIVVNGKVNQNAAWYYPMPKPAAKNIKGHVAFWNGVRVEK